MGREPLPQTLFFQECSMCKANESRGEQISTKGTVCQSCGMPLSKIRRAARKQMEADEQDYCSHCYQIGQFTLPYLTVEEMVAMVQGILKMHVPGFLARKFTNDIPNLKRWKSEPLHVESETPIICTLALPSTDRVTLQDDIEQARLDFVGRDVQECITFATVAETAYSTGHQEHAARTIASAEKGYSHMLRYFSQAKNLTPEQRKNSNGLSNSEPLNRLQRRR